MSPKSIPSSYRSAVSRALPKALSAHRSSTRPGSSAHHRWEFFEILARSLGRQVDVSGIPPTLFWANTAGGVDHAQVIAYREPTIPGTREPHVLRIGINSHGCRRVGLRVRRATRRQSIGAKPAWRFELSVLASELADFAPWIADLARAHEASSTENLGDPPHPCHFWFQGTPILEVNYGWSQAAWEANDAWRKRFLRRRQRPSEAPAKEAA
jgi:hypothetical protein